MIETCNVFKLTLISLEDFFPFPFSGYLIEWSNYSDFATYSSATVALCNLTGDRLPSYANKNENFLFYSLENMIPGMPYFIRVAAINQAGIGPMAFALPSPITPGAKPDQISPSGVLLTVVKSDSQGSNVLEASTCLHIEWRPPLRNNGYNVTHYRLERWRLPGKPEIQEVSLSFSQGNPPTGTFTLSFDGFMTDSLAVDVSEKGLKDALQSLPSISSVEVARRDENCKYVWKVTFWTQTTSTSGKNLLVDPSTDLLAGSSTSNKPVLLVTKISPGSTPADHFVIDVPNVNVNLLLNPTRYTFTGLATGVSYFVQVSSCNLLGCSAPRASFPLQLAPPKQKPLKPSQISLNVVSEQSLMVYFSNPLHNGGDPVTSFKIEWDTASSFKSSRGFPIGSHNYLVSSLDEGCSPCSFVIAGLRKGVAYFVRVFSYNSLGYSIEYGIPSPPSESPKTQASPPAVVHVIPSSEATLLVSFPASADSGGGFVSKYKVEWDAMGYYWGASIKEGPSSEKLAPPLFASHSVQTITLRSDSNNLGGTFRVAFEGYATDSLKADCTNDDMKLALESLPTVGSVQVDKSEIKTTYVFAITFLTNLGDRSWFGEISELTVSVNNNDVPSLFVSNTSGMNGTLTGTNAAVDVTVYVRAWEGFEQQSVSTHCSSAQSTLGGVFSLSFGGVSTPLLPHNVTAEVMKLELEKLGRAGRVYVTRAKNVHGSNSYTWNIIFLEKLGNLPLITAVYRQLTCFGGNSLAKIIVDEKQAGRLPLMGSSLYGSKEFDVGSQQTSFSYEIDRLHSGVEYYVQVSAWNGVGNVYGLPKYSTPAVACTTNQLPPVSNVALAPLDDTAVRVSWIPTLLLYSSCFSPKYRIEWTAEHGVAEVQVLKALNKSIHGKDKNLSGKFYVSFRGLKSNPVSLQASEQTLKVALESMPNIDDIAVTRTDTTDEISWAITFLNNVGDLPLLEVHPIDDKNFSFDLQVKEVRAGTDPVFNTNSRGFGSAEISSKPEVQIISVTSSANDLHGYFKVYFMGQISEPISCGSDAASFKEALEAMSTIACVDVSTQYTQQSSYPPITRSIRQWTITFTCQPGNLPSLLVSTGTSPPSLIAAGGSLAGRSAIVEVKTTTHGYILSEFTIEKLVTQRYYAQVFSSNDGLQWATPSLVLFGVSPVKCVPSRPTNAIARVLSGSEIEVLWHAPEVDGGEPVSKYSIQWGQDYSFSSSSAIVYVEPGNTIFSFVISGLHPFTSYFIRILAYNAIGYSEPITAVPQNIKIIQICLYNETHTVNVNESFVIIYSAEGVEENTPELSVHATAATVEDALNTMQNVIQTVSVTREDHSYSVDASGLHTMPFKVIYRITFYSETGRRSAGVLSVGCNFITVSSNVTLISDSLESGFAISPFKREPSSPRNVILSVVSQTELGVTWDPPMYSSEGSTVKYLVEWDRSYSFNSSMATVTTDVQNQITGLEPYQVYFVRVSAGNEWGYSDSFSSAPLSGKTQRVPLHKPSSVVLSVSPAEISNRLKIEWGLPSVDSRGFVTDLDECGLHQGHSTDAATHYTIMWDTHPSMGSASFFNATMVTGDGASQNCCHNSRCSIEIGTEVQTISVISNAAESISSGSFKVVYVGRQSNSAVVKVTYGSYVVEVISFKGNRTVQPGDFVRIYDSLSLVTEYSHPKIILSSPYQGVTSAEVSAFFNTPPGRCFDVAGANKAMDMQTHIAENFDDSPFDESIVVSRVELGNGFDYHITFTGPAFSELTEELFIVSNLEPWGDITCSNFFEVNGKKTSSVSVAVYTNMDSATLSPGTLYYFQIAAVNSAGQGAFSQSTPASLIPRAPPGLAENCKIYAVPDSPGSFKVEWEGVDSNHGSDLLSYNVDFYRSDGDQLNLDFSLSLDATNEIYRYSITQKGFEVGTLYQAWIVSVNGEGTGGPSWYTNVKNLNGELREVEFLSYKHRSCLCVPTCDKSSEDCFEGHQSLIKSRGFPGPPEIVSIGGSLQDGAASESRFSRNSVLVSYQTPSVTKLGGEFADKYRIQWATSTNLSSASMQSHITSDLQYLITDLDMGTEYIVRVCAHNSAGYGPSSEDVTVKPIQSPDPPFSPTLTLLSDAFSPNAVGTSLQVSWGYPTVDNVNGRSDVVGDGGDLVLGYLVEWSTVPWHGK